jgi:uncharacterized membrane protein YbaN (DUF454 family)
MEALLIRNRFFAPFLCYVDRTRPIPPRAKAVAIGMMWLFVGLAVLAFTTGDGASAGWASAVVVLAAIVGTAVIARWDAALRR